MTSIRLEKKTVEFDGRVWEICCNMAVLDELQEAHGGDFSAVMNLPSMQAAAAIFAAMLNDYAEDMGWEIRYTPRQVAKLVPFSALQEMDIIGMFTRAVIPIGVPQAAPESDADPGN